MKKILFCCITFILISSVGFSQMQLNLRTAETSSNESCFTKDNPRTNPKPGLQPKVIISGSDNYLLKSPWLIGLLLDVSFLQDESELRGSTGYSVHVAAGYLISNNFLIALRFGYMKFANDVGHNGSSSENEQIKIPVLVGVNYIFKTRKAFRPYFGFAFGFIVQNYNSKITYVYNNIIREYSNTETSSAFITELGLYYVVTSATMIQLALSYSIVFNKLDPDAYLSILAGVTFALGGN
jgi:outer membrane protein W